MPSLKCQIFSFQIFRQNFRILLTMEPIANHSLKNNDKKRLENLPSKYLGKKLKAFYIITQLHYVSRQSISHG